MTTNNNNNPLQAQLTTHLQTRHSLPVSPAWLSNFLASTRPPHPPLAALASTAQFRLLSSDIRTSLSPNNDSSGVLPTSIADVTAKEVILQRDVVVQVLDIQDIGRSKSAQIEAVERVLRGEEIRGREVVRVVRGLDDDRGDDDNDAGTGTGGGGRANAYAHTATTTNASSAAAAVATKRSQGPHLLTVQDCAGTNVAAFEMQEIAKCWIGIAGGGDEAGSGGGTGMSIGCKIVLKRGTIVRRGTVMLETEKTVVLGGKVDSWDRKWREERLGRLKSALDREDEERDG